MNRFIERTVVADDNSSDRTVEEAEGAGAYIVRNFGKRGFGANTKSGIDRALIMDCDIIVTMDGDGQHKPEEVLLVTEEIEKGNADVVIGSRFLRNNSVIPRYRRIGIRIITWLYNVGSRQKVSDAQCCFRAYRTEVLRNMSIAESGFTFSTETLIKARAMGYRIREVPITVLYHKQFSRNSTLNPVIQGLNVALGTARVRLKVELLGKIIRLFRRQSCLSSGL
jgi:glycosyltransferase involved in cell wall biosynthesis